MFRVSCVSAEEQELVMAVNNDTFVTTFLDLQYYTQYNCCVEAIYTNSFENAYACLVESTDESGIYSGTPKCGHLKNQGR